MRTRLLISLVVLSSCEGTVSSLEPTIPGTNCKLTPPPTALVRLTHLQYDNTVKALLGVSATPSMGFTPDPSFSGFNNSAEGLVVVDRLGRDYRRAAEELATLTINTPVARTTVVPCSNTTDVCAQQFVDVFGRRAFRRPLTNAESAAYFALFKRGGALVDGAPDAFTAGVSLTIEAMLQSPDFLYRVEVDLEPSTAGLAKLTPYEVASKLSYLLWNTMPDNALLDAADRGALGTTEEVRAQVLRMLDDSRAINTIDDFHGQWLELERYRTIVRDPALFPAFNSTLSGLMQEETLRFVRAVVLEDKAPFQTMYSANFTFVNADLARVYGMQGITGGAFTRVTMDADQRKGLLTQPGLLASHSYSRTSSPIHRGVFVVRRVLGQVQPDPPPGIDFTLPPIDGMIRTTREQVTVKTSARDCAGCHVNINVPGFAFENYDALGQFRTKENNIDVDATGTLQLSDGAHPFTNALGMIDAISNSAEARGSYATNWFRYASQRPTGDNDSCDVKQLTDGLADPTRATRELLIDLALLPSFTLRSENTP